MSFFASFAATIVSASLHGSLEWRIIIDDFPSTVEIQAAIPTDALPRSDELTLTFSDTPTEDRGRIKLVSAAQGDHEPLVEWLPDSSRLQYRIRHFSRTKPLTLTYSMDPVFYPPGSIGNDRREARAILEPTGGVLRTHTIFPASNLRTDAHRVSFVLPEGWRALTPWRPISESIFILSDREFRATDYLSVGPLDIETLTVEDMEIRVGGFPGVDLPLDSVVEVINLLTRDFGPIPNASSGPRCLTIVPPDFIHGGSSGSRSSVQNTHVVTLVHEIFHWWNPGSRGSPETRWFGEGVTTYVGVRYAHVAQLISAQELKACFADLYGEMRFLERSGANSLSRAGREATGEAQMSRLNYSKGALVTWLLQEQLQSEGKDVVDGIRRVVLETAPGFSNQDIFAIIRDEFSIETADMLRQWVVDRVALPKRSFGTATGASGIARFLPLETTVR